MTIGNGRCAVIELDQILAVKRSDTPRGPRAVGTIACDGCKAECWIAQSSIDLLARRPSIRVLCVQCVSELPDGSIEEVRTVPGARLQPSELLASSNYTDVADVLRRKVRRQ